MRFLRTNFAGTGDVVKKSRTAFNAVLSMVSMNEDSRLTTYSEQYSHDPLALRYQQFTDGQTLDALKLQPASALQHATFPSQVQCTPSIVAPTSGDSEIAEHCKHVITHVPATGNGRTYRGEIEAKLKDYTGVFLDLLPSAWTGVNHPGALQISSQNQPESFSRISWASCIHQYLVSWIWKHGEDNGHRFVNSNHEFISDAVHNEPDNSWQTASFEGFDHQDTLLGKIPNYVTEYAPLVHLYSGEEFWPCDIAEHLDHTTPNLNYTAVETQLKHPTLKNLDLLNQWQRGRFVYLTSDDNVEERPDWLEGAKNIPSTVTIDEDDVRAKKLWEHHAGRTLADVSNDVYEQTREQPATVHSTTLAHDEVPSHLLAHLDHTIAETISRKWQNQVSNQDKQYKPADQTPQTIGGRSDAPAVLIVVDKGHGIVDAFWFFFYSFNLGNKVLNIRFGNHVGDWEHTAIRFHHGEPKAVFFSEHNFGSAYSYAAVEKFGKRPVIYSATGTHAMYATPGNHPYVLPLGILHDETDKGPLWDPALNSHTYTYDIKSDSLRASNITPKAPTGWFHFSGHWGDKIYPLGDRRQYRLAGQYHYVSGPLGPKFKNLARKKICGGPDSAPCVIKNWLGGSANPKRWQSNGIQADAFSAYAEEQWSQHD